MRDRILSIIVVLGILAFGIYYFTSGSSIVQTDTVKLDINKLNGKLYNWVNENKSEGIYIGRIPHNRKNEKYYIYLNYKKSMGLSVSTVRKDGLEISWGVGMYQNYEKEVYEISTNNKRPDYIIFGEKKMDILSIPIIK